MANRVQPSIQPYPPRPIPRSVKQAIAAAKKPAPPARDPIIEENRSRPEATMIIRAAERGRVTPNEVADIAEVVERGISPDGHHTMATPELQGDQFYITGAAAERLTTFVEKYGTTIGTARIDASIMKALATRGPYGHADITEGEAKGIVRAAEKSGGVNLDEVQRVQTLLANGVDAMTEAVGETMGDSFYLDTKAREVLEDLVMRNGPRPFPPPNRPLARASGIGMCDDLEGDVEDASVPATSVTGPVFTVPDGATFSGSGMCDDLEGLVEDVAAPATSVTGPVFTVPDGATFSGSGMCDDLEGLVEDAAAPATRFGDRD